MRREFVSSISHELKSPLAVISGYAQVLQSGAISSKEDVDYYIGIINEETERMGVIVSDLLDLYKLESNTFKLNIEEFDIYDLSLIHIWEVFTPWLNKSGRYTLIPIPARATISKKLLNSFMIKDKFMGIMFTE